MNRLDGESIALTLIVYDQNHDYLKLNHYEKNFKSCNHSVYSSVLQPDAAWTAYNRKN
ncbi:hypothetical protein CRS_05450 [Chryseobacterium sp. ON_d1]|nr:hypothetical protein CRS_05450 [Chryseobacterium sp. ON_d1]